jgi:penicillin amidase
VVDASSHSARADSAEEFRFGSGPVRRFVGTAEPFFQGITAESSLPGGTSGVPGDPLSLNLLGRWLTNETYPVRLRAADVQAGRASREVLMPAH